MQQEDKKINQLLSGLKKAVLSKAEKDSIRKNIIAFMRQEAMPREPFVSWNVAHFTNFFPRSLALRYVSLAMVLSLFFSTGVSFAAQKSLPGELLYPIKTGINEKVLGLLLVSDKAKAKYNVELVQLRLEEIEKVFSQDALDEKKSEKMQKLLAKHIQEVADRASDIGNKKDPNFSLEINSELEASLNAHKQILDTLAKRPGKKSSDIERIASSVQNKAEETVKSRQSAELKVSGRGGSNDDSKIFAEKKLNEALNKINEAKRFLVEKKLTIQASTYQKAENDLVIANENIESGKLEVTEKDFTNAFFFFENAVRKTREIKIYVMQESQLKVNEKIENDADIEEKQTDEIKSDESSKLPTVSIQNKVLVED